MATCFLYDACNHKDCDKDFCLRQYKMEILYKNSLISDTQRRHITLYLDNNQVDLQEFKRLSEIEKDIENFVREGKNLFLHSAVCGNGKTSWSLRLVEAYFNKIWVKSDLSCHALFISVPRFLLALKDDITNKSDYVAFIKNNIKQADIVIWDDIAAKTGTDFELNHLLNMIETRIALGKTNIYTSNLNTTEMYTAVGERLTSRICNLSIDIELHGADKRKVCNGGI